MKSLIFLLCIFAAAFLPPKRHQWKHLQISLSEGFSQSSHHAVSMTWMTEVQTRCSPEFRPSCGLSRSTSVPCWIKLQLAGLARPQSFHNCSLRVKAHSTFCPVALVAAGHQRGRPGLWSWTRLLLLLRAPLDLGSASVGAPVLLSLLCVGGVCSSPPLAMVPPWGCRSTSEVGPELLLTLFW